MSSSRQPKRHDPGAKPNRPGRHHRTTTELPPSYLTTATTAGRSADLPQHPLGRLLLNTYLTLLLQKQSARISPRILACCYHDPAQGKARRIVYGNIQQTNSCIPDDAELHRQLRSPHRRMRRQFSDEEAWPSRYIDLPWLYDFDNVY